MKLLCVVGVRPNFIKVAPLLAAARAHRHPFEVSLVHTGQHYDKRMSGAFFADLGIPPPDIDLGVGSGGHAQQTARVMMAFEPVLLESDPDVVVVVGDVNSTLACALTAKKLHYRVSHIEAGLRSGDMATPEEINRICTDAISDDLFTTDRMADANLAREGVPGERIHFVGNVMIDTLIRHLPAARDARIAERLGINRPYATLTLHRPTNVDDGETLAALLEAVLAGTGDMPVVFPVHPRTRSTIERCGLTRFLRDDPGPGLFAVEPMGYLDFLGLNAGARLVVTDSGGLQEETSVLGVPCVTLRERTERPITVQQGTNIVAGNDPGRVRAAIAEGLGREVGGGQTPELWDGHAAERIVDILAERS